MFRRSRKKMPGATARYRPATCGLPGSTGAICCKAHPQFYLVDTRFTDSRLDVQYRLPPCPIIECTALWCFLNQAMR